MVSVSENAGKGVGLRVRWSLLIVLLSAGGALAGCSDAPLSDMGHLTQRWIAAAPETTAPAPPVTAPAPLGLLATDGSRAIEWVNDELGDPSSVVPAEAIAEVWARSSQEDRYVQASRSEISAALPGLVFPELIPQNVAFVTSQLVFDPSTGRLSPDTKAAFGFWSVTPYSKSRSVAQLAVLMVSATPEPAEPAVVDTIGVPESSPGSTRCDDLAGSTVEDCKAMFLEDGCPAWSVEVTDGWRLVWSERGYEYDLFVRSAANIDLLAQMAGSCEELRPTISAEVDKDAGDGAQAEVTGEDLASASDS
jgi:hypothetical protein